MEKTEYLVTLGRRVAYARIKAGMSMEALGKKTGKTRQMINRLEKGQTSANVYYLYQVAAALGLHLHDLLNFHSVDSQQPEESGDSSQEQEISQE